MTVSVNIPEDLYRQAQEIAESQSVPVDEVISSGCSRSTSQRGNG